MTTLGQAYVQIMPSAKGISGSIQKTINPEATAAGKSAGSRIASSIADSIGKAGKTLTKSITLPALGAATAVGGVVAAFGWKRLVALDSARAQLQGLGYDAKSVDKISEQVRKAVQGTVTTMAEGVSIAAGGLAAGVKEGAELERYIKLVGDAAVGANRPVNDMAQIFNRVQGSGKLMTQELNMIEDGMPGFAMAMAKSLDVPQEEFRKMVTAGKVSSEQFLDVMDDFAGEMSGAYAKSWEGMVSNTKAWIGIIGQNILGGVFEQSKESIAEFMEFLKSDDIQAWAKETGQAVGDAFNRMIESVQSAIKWWAGLDGSTKSLIAKIAGIAVAIGPILMIVSKLITTVMTLGRWFGIIKAAAGALIGAIGAISAPVLIVIGVIAGLIAVFVSLYKSNEGFRDSVQTVWAKIKETISTVIQAISDFVMGIFGALVSWWNDNSQQIFETAQNIWNSIVDVVSTVVQTIVDFVMEIWSTLVAFWNEHGAMIMEATMNVFNAIRDVVTDVVTKVWEIIQKVWPTIQSIISIVMGGILNTIKIVWNLIKGVIKGALDIVMGVIQFFAALFTGNWKGMWEAVKRVLGGALGIVMSVVSAAFNTVKNTIQTYLKIALRIVLDVIYSIRDKIRTVFYALTAIVTTAFTRVRDAVQDGIRGAYDKVLGFLGKFKDAGANIVTSIADGIKGAISKVTDAISGVVKKVRDFLPFSPAKEGPLKDLDKLNFGGTISVGIDDGADDVQRAMEEMLSFDLPKKATFSSPQRYNSSGRDITINNTFTSKEMTPSEISRKQRQQLEQVALGW